MIAWLLEDDYSYYTEPQRVMSLLVATADKTSDYGQPVVDENNVITETTAIGHFDNRTGAGIIDFNRMITDNTYRCVLNRNTLSGCSVITQDIYLQSGTDVQIASAWFAKTSTTMDHSIPVVSEILVTDYNIYLVNTTLGNTTDYVTVASSTLSNSNIEMIRYHAELSGTYRIIVYQAGNMHENNTSDWVYLNYNS